MNLRSLDWRYLSAVSTFALVVFGAGVSLGRYIPAQHGDESTELRDKLAHICTGEESILSDEICRTSFAAYSRFEQPSISSNESQLQKNTQFLDWVTASILDSRHTTTGTFPMSQIEGLQNFSSPSSTLCQFKSRDLPRTSPPSKTQRVLFTIGTICVCIWEFLFVYITFSSIATATNARYVFAIWACVPSIWFFKHAPWYLVWTWYCLATTATADLRWTLPVPRTLLFFYLCVLSSVTLVFHIFRSNSEIPLYLVLFIIVAVPLEPAFDYVLEFVPKIPIPDTEG